MSNENSVTDGEVQVLQPSAIEAVEKANIDIQIATAHQYPRSIDNFKKRAMAMVSLDEETAQSCIYRRVVGKKNGKPEYAEGLSVRTAEIVGACYGNLRVGSMLVEETPEYVKARGFAHDLESNFMSACEVVESTLTKEGKPYSQRMRITVAKACLAKARRDATFQVVPKALCKAIEEQARKVAIGNEATLDSRRKVVVDWVNKLGIEPIRVWNAIGVEGPDDIGLKELELLTGLRTSINDKETTLDEAFPADAGITMPKAKSPQNGAEGPKSPEAGKETPKGKKGASAKAGKQEKGPEGDIIAEIKALREKVTPEDMIQCCKAVGVKLEAGEAWEQSDDDTKVALRSLLSAKVGNA